MATGHDHHRSATTPETRSAIGTAVVAVVAYEVAAGLVNDWLDADLVPSVMPRIQATTPRTVAKALSPQWTRYAGWVAAGALYTVAARAARSALPARLRR